ncbi:oligosaccharide flippase family protein [Dysgonomonadaceae bacterium zrk40]|nr:oligosaccharide flippase family protein [Dysgonomonadaceae bacterium zrk40]
MLTKYLIEFWEKLKANTFYRNIAIVASGNITARLITILLTPVITRIYSPADYGIYSVFMSIIGITGALVTLRYSVTIPVARDEKLADNLLKLCFIITITLSLLWLLFILLFGEYISIHFDSEGLKSFLWLMPIVFFGKGIYEALTNWAVRYRDFKLITRTKLTQSVSSSIVKIGLGLLNIKPLGLLIGHIVSETAGVANIFSKLIKTRPEFFKELSLPAIKSAAIRYKRFPLVQSWSQLLLSAGAQLPVLLLGFYHGAEIVGIFGLANTMIRLPMDLVGQSVSQVYFGEISKFGKENPRKIYNLTVTLIIRLLKVGIIPIALIALLGPWIFSIVFGAEWSDAGLYARILSIYVLFAFLSAPVANIFNVYERMDIQLSLNIFRVVLVILVFVICGYLELTPIYTIGIYSLLLSFYYLFLVLRVLKLVKPNVKN